MGLLVTLCLLALITLGLIVGVAAALAAIIGAWATFGDPFGPRVPMMVSRLSIDRIQDFLLLSIPFFILTARLMNSGGVTERLFAFIAMALRPIRGGLAHANVMASFVFAGMSGSATADVAGLGAIEMRAMRLAGYPDSFSAGITAASALLSPIIPPSIVLIAYSVQSGQSVATMFLATIVPGVLLAFMLMLWVAYQAYRLDMPKGTLPSGRELLVAGRRATLPALTPVIILAGIYLGIFTPTEAAAVAVVYALFLSRFVLKELTWAQFLHELKGTVIDTSALLFIIAMTSAFGVVMLRLGLPQALASFIDGITSEATGVMLLVVAICIVVGCFMAQTPAIIILTPILLPIAERAGINLVHFGCVMSITLTLGLLTPPVGMVLYVLHKVANISIDALFRSVAPFIIVVLIHILLLVFFPGLALFLPHSLGYH